MFQSHIDIKNIKEKLRITIQAPEQELSKAMTFQLLQL